MSLSNFNNNRVVVFLILLPHFKAPGNLISTSHTLYLSPFFHLPLSLAKKFPLQPNQLDFLFWVLQIEVTEQIRRGINTCTDVIAQLKFLKTYAKIYFFAIYMYMCIYMTFICYDLKTGYYQNIQTGRYQVIICKNPAIAAKKKPLKILPERFEV